MPTDLNLKIIAERPVVRNDQTSDIDIAVDLVTTKSIGTQSSGYALNLCVVIDRSGSMAGEKLEQAKRSCVNIYESLGPDDRLTILAFDDDVISVANPQTPRSLVKERILALQSGGSTNLSNGWYLGLLELQTYSTDKHINRLILLSDGQANAGEQKSSVLGSESSRARNELRITTSTIGIGKDFQEDILAALAHESGGRFWFIGEARIEDIIKEEFSGALSVLLERPGIELEFPAGVSIAKELNDLAKISGRYRIRPIKGNDRFCFAIRFRIDPSIIKDNSLSVGAKLLDSTEVIERAETILKIGSVEEYVQSSEDPLVAMVVRKYLAATSDEKIAQQMEAGNVTAMLTMLQDQSDLMKDLEVKLAGAAITSWERMTEQEKERKRAERERELFALRMEIEENKVLVVVGQLMDLLQGLGRSAQALDFSMDCRKMPKHREMRKRSWEDRGGVDDWAAEDLLRKALNVSQELLRDFPHLENELNEIQGRIHEQLARFS